MKFLNIFNLIGTGAVAELLVKITRQKSAVASTPKSILKSIPALLVLVLASTASPAQDGEAKAQTVALPHCDKPIAAVMVGKLACKAANCNTGATSGGASGIAMFLQMANAVNGGMTNVSGIADGIRDVLVTALSETRCFDVQDRDAMEEINAELQRAGKKVQTQQADYLISGAVTQIDVSTESKSFGGGFIPILGTIGTKTQKASVALDMKLIDINTSKVVASKRATASTENSSFSLGMGGIGMHSGLIGGFGGSLSSQKGTNLEAVTKDALLQSVVFLVEAARNSPSAATAKAGTPAEVVTAVTK